MKVIYLSIAAGVVLLLGLVFSCKKKATAPQETSETASFTRPRTPEWAKNATIYEVNLRQYTPEGTFKAFEAELPRLKNMGIDILWFMPIHPISEKNKKGSLGSPYAVDDYTGVNPDYGTMDEFKHLLKAIHDAGMYCIIDWVPNHTGWSNKWITQHPDWYSQDSQGNIIDPIDYNTGKPWGWTDVADLNYDNPEMRLGMIDAMRFWVEDVGIDGFRVDVAHGVPVDFFEQATDTLFAIKPLFMLAEAEVPALLNTGSFVMDYGWEMHHLLNDIATTQGANRRKQVKLVNGNLVDGEGTPFKKKNATHIDSLLAAKAALYEKGYHMQFTSNHDENSWADTEFGRLGDGHKAFAVLTATFDGMPLIYTGMESAMDKKLEFFEKDLVPWGDYPYADFYTALFALKHRNQALWNGTDGGPLVKIPTGKDEFVYAFTREKNGDKVAVIINLSAQEQAFTLQGSQHAGTYTELFSGASTTLVANQAMTLKAWDYLVLTNK